MEGDQERPTHPRSLQGFGVVWRFRTASVSESDPATATRISRPWSLQPGFWRNLPALVGPERPDQSFELSLELGVVVLPAGKVGGQALPIECYALPVRYIRPVSPNSA